MKNQIKTVVALLVFALFSCEDEKTKVASNLEFSVTAHSQCIDDYYLYVKVDKDDKFEWQGKLECNTIKGYGYVDAGDSLELHVYKMENFDKSILYDYTVKFEGKETVITNESWKGIGIKLK